jgi:hypothetical protein
MYINYWQTLSGTVKFSILVTILLGYFVGFHSGLLIGSGRLSLWPKGKGACKDELK